MCIDNATTKFHTRNLNVLDISEVDIVLVSCFNDLFGLPFITRMPDFRGQVLMTLPLAQVGQHLVLELVAANAKRNQKKDIQPAFLKQEKMHEVFAGLGIEEW